MPKAKKEKSDKSGKAEKASKKAKPKKPSKKKAGKGEKSAPDPKAEQIETVWEKANQARGMDPKLYRKDPHGNMMYKPAHGKDAPMGWVVDYIVPLSRGGADETANLQAVSIRASREKRDGPVRKSRRAGF